MMLFLASFVSAAFAQDTGTSPLYCEDTECAAYYDAICHPVPVAAPDVCPLQAFPAEDTPDSSWVTGDGHWHRDGAWAFLPARDPFNEVFSVAPTSLTAGSTYDPRRPGLGDRVDVSDEENECAIIKPDGKIFCWGNSQMQPAQKLLTPLTGGEPYSHIDAGYWANSIVQAIYGALDATGHVVLWGGTNTGGVTGTIVTTMPTGGGWDTFALGNSAACVADEQATSGITCWGSDTNLLLSGAPTTGTYQSIAIGRFTALAITKGSVPGDGGSMTLWGAGSAQQVDFRSRAPGTSDILSAELTESGPQVGLAWHDDHTLTVWQQFDGPGMMDMLENVPCTNTDEDPRAGDADTTNCPAGADRSWHGRVKFRTMPRMSHTSTGSICGVVQEDPDNVYNCGDMICWGHIGSSSGVPQVITTCPESIESQAYCKSTSY